MNLFFNTIWLLCLIFYYVVEAVVLPLIPRRFRSKSVAGQTVLITGAGSGIGRQLAVRFSQLGTRLVLLDINMKGLRETEVLLDKNLNGVFLYECDVSDRNAVYALAAKIKDEIGSVDILVNNAGVVTGKKLMECPDDMIKRTFAINTLAHFWTCKAFLPDMKSANRGHLVFVASVASFGGAPKLADYCASKFAVRGFEESLRLELDEEGLSGVKSTIVCPYMVATGLFDGFNIPFLKALTPEYVADKIVSAVLIDQELLILPCSLVFLIILNTFLPRTASRVIADAIGYGRCMDNFRGRQSETNSTESDKLQKTDISDQQM